MNLSDLIFALQRLQDRHGNLAVLERRMVWHESTELFRGGIDLDQKVLTVAAWYEPADGKHHWHEAKFVAADAADRREFLALVI